LIKRKPLPSDQSKMYVYARNIVEKFETEPTFDELKKKHIQEMEKKNSKTRSEFQRLYMNKTGFYTDFTKNEDDA